MHRIITEHPVPGAFTNGRQDTIRIGEAQWDPNELSVKYCWRGKDGKVARGGEMPLDAVPVMLEALVELAKK